MNKTFGLLYCLKRSKINASGKCPVYLRITVDGKRIEISIKRSVDPARWCTISNAVMGRTEEVKQFNTYLDILKSKVYVCQKDLISDNKEVTAESLKNKFLGIEESSRKIIMIFQNHNNQVKHLVGIEYAKGTLDRYETALKHLQSFIKHKYKVSDVNIKSIDHVFITDFEFYLKKIRGCRHNTSIKYIKNFKKIMNEALAKSWVDRDPFLNYKMSLNEVEREFLSEQEIKVLLNKELHTPRLEQVRDVFVFCCFTGFAYVDVKKLTQNNLVYGIDGGQWIKAKRTKTGSQCNIPVLPTAQIILDKYKEHSEVLLKGVLLPVLSNQKSNAYLKEIANLCGINKTLTTHLARHTFATTVTLSNGVPIESVSKMLGHKSIKTTQHYAKVLDNKVQGDMAILKEKLSTSNTYQSQKQHIPDFS